MPLNRQLPTALYRLQLRPNYSFKSIQEQLFQISALKIDTLFLSSIHQVVTDEEGRAELTAGVVDFNQCHPSIGTAQEFSRLAEAVKEQQMGLVVEIRPSYMDVSSSHNRWWRELLQRGIHSPYSRWFEIDWTPYHHKWANQVFLPILEESYASALQKRLLQIHYDKGAFFLRYRDQLLPLSYETWWTLINTWVKNLAGKLTADTVELLELAGMKNQLSLMCQRDQVLPNDLTVEAKERRLLSRRIDQFWRSYPHAQEALQAVLEEYECQTTESIYKFDKLLHIQTYRLAPQKNALQEINYRRYEANERSVAMRFELAECVQQVFSIPLAMMRQRLIQGICIGDVDSTLDPKDLFKHLHSRIQDHTAEDQEEPYLFVEYGNPPSAKLPDLWNVQGLRHRSSIDLLAALNFEHKKLDALEEAYRTFTGQALPYLEEAIQFNRRLLKDQFRSDFLRLSAKGLILTELHYSWRDITLDQMQQGLELLLAIGGALLIGCNSLDSNDLEQRQRCYEMLVNQLPLSHKGVAVFMKMLILQQQPSGLSKPQQELILAFRSATELLMNSLHHLRLQAMVGSDLSLCCQSERWSLLVMPQSIQQLHDHFLQRSQQAPYSVTLSHSEEMILSEEGRARLHLLSEIPQTWEKSLQRWQQMNGSKKVSFKGKVIPTAKEELFLYQILVATWIPGQTGAQYCLENLDKLISILKRIYTKSSKGKEWEDLLAQFITAILTDLMHPFVEHFERFVLKLHRSSLYNSLALTFLKLTAPGIPEIYHGSQSWNFSLNGFSESNLIAEESKGSLAQLFETLENGAIKSALIRQTLTLRRAYPTLLTEGEYIPLTVKGVRSSHVFAFGRRTADKIVIAAVIRLYQTLLGSEDRLPIDSELWRGHRLLLDHSFSGRYRNHYTGKEYRLGGAGGEFSLALEELFSDLPFVLLERLS